MSRGEDGVVDEEDEARGEEVVRLSASSSELLLWLPPSSIDTDITETQINTLNMQTHGWKKQTKKPKSTNIKQCWHGVNEQTIPEILTRQPVGLHFEVGDVIVACVPLRAYTLLPGSHGEGPSLGVDLLGDTLQIPQGCTVLRLRRHEFCLTLFHEWLQLLWEINRNVVWVS